MIRLRRAALALSLLAAAVVAGSAAAHGPTAASNKRAAQQAAPRLLAALALPPGATAVTADPSRPHVLGGAPTRPLTPRLVDVHGFWRVPGDPQTVLAWIEDHPPTAGMRGVSGASAYSNGASTEWDGYTFKPVPGILYSRTLLVEVAAAAGGATALRADAQVVWYLPRPASERVPAGVRAIAISWRRPVNQASGSVEVTDATKVRQIVRWVDGLATTQVTTLSCPNDTGPSVKLSFERSADSAPLAIVTADGSGCGFVSFGLSGRAQPPLSGGPKLIDRLQSLLHVSFG